MGRRGKRATSGGPKVTAMPDTIDVYGLMHELNRCYGGRAPGYQRIWSLAIADRIPARREARRWLFKRADIPAIAKTLGLTDPPAAA